MVYEIRTPRNSGESRAGRGSVTHNRRLAPEGSCSRGEPAVSPCMSEKKKIGEMQGVA